MPRTLCFLCLLLLLHAPGLGAEILRIPASADIWLSHATERESETGAGGSTVFKLKSVQELAALRFPLEVARGHEILRARLHLRVRGEDAPRWMRVSTVTSLWSEGRATRAYSGHDGATWQYADEVQEKPWSWPGSNFADVCMGAGNSLVETVELQSEEDGWWSAELSPRLVSAVLCGAGDGFALMEGGSPHNENHYFHSAQSWESGPWLELDLGEERATFPTAPVITVGPASERATLQRSAVRVSVATDSTTFALQGWLNGVAMDPWRLPHAGENGDLSFYLDDLGPRSEFLLELRALSRSGESSPAAAVSFISPPAAPGAPPFSPLPTTLPVMRREQPPTLWALPALARIDARRGVLLDAPTGETSVAAWDANPVWDGQRVHLVAARGERVAFTLVLERSACAASPRIRVIPTTLSAMDRAVIPAHAWSLRETWYRPRGGQIEGSYLRPVENGIWLGDAGEEGLPADAAWRTLRAEIFIDPGTESGRYRGAIVVEYQCGRARLLPIELEVASLQLSAEPSFRIELNAYRVPENAVECFRLARRHRAVFTPWVYAPALSGEPPDLQVDWSEYDQQLAPLLDGSAFPEDPRPLEVLYLPFWESWPLELSPENYAYPAPWPAEGDPFESMWDHHEQAAPIGQALAEEYLQTLRAVQRQFVHHFEGRGWRRTELHAFYGSKMRHLTRYGRMSWWNTDEPLYLADWQALGFFLDYFEAGLHPAEQAQWIPRADISRPEWIEGALGSTARIVYTGGMRSAADARRMRTAARELSFRWMIYGAASSEDEEPVVSALWALEAYLDGAQGALVWLSLGNRDSWRDQDPEEFPGTALMTQLPTFETPVGDLRLLALREAQQLSGWLDALAAREGLTASQMEGLLAPLFARSEASWWRGQSSQPGRIRRGELGAYGLAQLRLLLAQRWESAPRLN